MESPPIQPIKLKKMFHFRYIFLGGIALVLSYAIFDRSKPVDIHSMVVVNRPQPGEEAIVKLDVFRHKLCYTKVEKALFDGQNIKFNVPSQAYQIVGHEGEDQFSIRVPVEEDAAPGQGKIRVVTTWICNYVHIAWPLTDTRDLPITISP